MKGDYSRVTFDRRAHYARVLMQQGRVLLDADWNEQTAILLHYLQTLAADLIGPHGGPAAHLGFAIEPMTTSTPPRLSDLRIGAGRYYVDGLLAEVESQTTYTTQPDWRGTEFSGQEEVELPLLAYLDVWERDVNSIEDPRIREVALGGPDTTARSKVVWQVRLHEFDGDADDFKCSTFATLPAWTELIETLQPADRGRLAADAATDESATGPCITSPEARYRGAENHLYRVEIHKGGPAGSATFKWSRDNGSVVFPVESIDGTRVALESLGRDDELALEIGDWVEVVEPHTDSGRGGAPSPLLRVEDVDLTELAVTLSAAPTADPQKLVYLRRWDQQEGDPNRGGLTLVSEGAAVVEATAISPKWLNLEDGIRIRFSPTGTYRRGDYWLIAARTETGDVDWPEENGQAILLPPHGVEHHYAPLAVLAADAATNQQSTFDLRHVIAPVAGCCPAVRVVAPLVNLNNQIQFTAELSHAVPDARFRWTAQNGAVLPPADQQTVFVETGPAGPAAPQVTATVVVETPGGCRVSASGTWVR